MPLDYTNPKVLKFLTENFEKAEERRMIWFLNNKEKLEQSASFPQNYKGLHTVEVRKLTVEACMPILALNHETSVGNRRRRALRDGVVRGVSQLQASSRSKSQPRTLKLTGTLVPEPVMKSIDTDVQSILYKALPNGGRRVYLDKRKRLLPEDKYNFCETNNSGYGWRLNDSELSRQPPKYGRYFTFKRDINSRSGPQPDPAYYQQPPDEPYSKCFG